MAEKFQTRFKSFEIKDAIAQVSINCVIFGFNEKKLNVIVNRISLGSKPIVVLPGGFVGQQENVSNAVERIVKESTGLENILLKQFAVFGDSDRAFTHDHIRRLPDVVFGKKLLKWLQQRFISICYLALVDYNKIDLKPTQFLESAQWLPVDKAKLLALDHADMVKSAKESLRELSYSLIASNLLPAKFTLPELHSLVEAIVGHNIDRANFRRKILSSAVLVKVGQDDSGNRRPADVYTFKFEKNTVTNF